MIGISVIAVVWCVIMLLLTIFRWDWLSKHPRLYLDRLGRWSGAEYDPKARIKAIIKFSVILALFCVLAVMLTNNYRNVLKLADYTQVNAGEALPLAGGELVFNGRVEDNEIVIVLDNAETGQYGNYIVHADTHDYGDALVAFTGIFTNTTEQSLMISNEDIKMYGIPTDIGSGYKFNGSWMADHKADGDGNVELAPGESVFLYFWAVLNKDKQTQSYAYVVQDGENYYRLNLDSLQSVPADALTAQNRYAAILEAEESISELVFGETYYGPNIGEVTLEGVRLVEGSSIMSRGTLYLDIELEIESSGKLWASALEQWMSVLILTEDSICWKGAEFSIEEQKEPVSTEEKYVSEVHYRLPLSENVQRYQIILSMGGNHYVMVADFGQ